ncbi:MAG: PilZ domain-containing protein [Myxococcales bacterium]|nr:PilZ domain-containing protein [Myxococcales bacterium]
MSYDRRKEVRLPVEICVQQFLAGESYLGLTRDLSERGLYITAPRSFDERATWFGAPLQLELALPGTGETIWARGLVCHEDSLDNDEVRGLGVRLIDMADRHAQSLRSYVESIRRARLHNLLLQMNRRQKLPGLIHSY